MVINGDLALYQSTFEGEVTLFGADISKNLFARDSKFNGVMPDPSSKYPFELWTTHVGQTTEFTNAVFKGEVIADDAQFGVNLNFDHTVFEKLATFQDVRVGNLANFQGATFKNTVTFESSIMNRDASFTGATFNGSANFDYVSVTRFFDFDKTTLNNSFSIQYSTIGWPYFESATLDGKVNFEGIQASNDLDFTNATYSFLTEPFTIELAKVDGRAKFPGFSAPAGVSLAHNQFGTLNISGRDGQKYAFINLDSTQVAGDFLLENITTDEFSAQGFVANGSTTFQQVAVANKLDFSNASLGVFTLDKEFWPKNPDTFNLRAMTFNDIIVSPELNEDTWPKLLNMVTESAYSPQAYRTLEDFLTEKGHPDWAADVELDRKIRERDHILAPRTGPWFWSWFLFIFSGYGQRPQYAFGWSLLVIVIGAIVFWKEDNLVMLEESEAKPPYNRWLYSFALFIPYIELGIAEKWDPKPEHKAAWMYKYVHKMLGWILTPIALLTFGGIIK
jgi:uncharacterized protein YjbI with pentapeptide repeats